MTLFHEIYKCRLCGESFEFSVTESRDTALKAVAGTAYDGKWYPEGGGIGVYMHQFHACKDGSFGIADFQGYKKEEDK